MQPKAVVVNDINAALIETYVAVRDDLEELLEHLKKFQNSPECFYKTRSLDRGKLKLAAMSRAARAARILYLNKTCYNGLFRVNSAGEFNAPYGNYKNPNFINEPVLRAVSRYLCKSNIRFATGDYASVLSSVEHGTFVYLDPPYDPISNSANFTGYSKGGFNKNDQIMLRKACDALNERGIKFMLSNSATDFIKEQYSAYDIKIVRAKRSINSIAAKRGAVDEVVVRNYE